MKKIIVILLTIALVCSFLTVHAEPITPTDVEPEITEELIPCEATVEDDFVAGEIMVGIKVAYSEVNKVWTADDFPELSGITRIEDLTYADTESAIETFSAKENFHQLLKIVISNTTESAVIAGIHALEQNDKLLFAEPNSIIEMEEPVVSQDNGIALANNLSLNNSERYQKYTNDPYLLQQDGIYLHNVDKVWNAFTKGSSSVVVGVIDTGVSAHSDLNANLTLGYDCTSGKNETSYCDPDGHGTSVASVIGAKGNNSKGITGVCQNVTLYPLRLYNTTGELTEGAVAAAYLKAEVNDIPIVNVSMGGDGYNSLIETTMGMYGGLIVCSAGNAAREITSSNPYYSPCYDIDNMISVGAINSNKTVWSDSNYSSTFVDIMALGSNVRCTSSSGGYLYSGGTSLAAPFVAGVAALLLSYDNTLTTAQLKQYILEGVQTVPALANYCSTGGYLDAYGAFLAMLEDKPLCVNLVTKAVEDANKYTFSIYHNNAYSRLVEIVPSVECRNDIESMTVTQTSDTITVTLDMYFAQYAGTPLIEFHFISYSTLNYAQTYIGVSQGTASYEQTVKSNSIPSSKILMGDATGNGVVDIMDQLRITQYTSDPTKITGDNLLAADVNSDGSINADDATQVGNYCVSSILSFY